MKKYKINIGDKLMVINTNLSVEDVKTNQPAIIQGLLHEMERTDRNAHQSNPVEVLKSAINNGTIRSVDEIQEFLESYRNNTRPSQKPHQEKHFKQVFATVINPSNNATAKFKFEDITTKEGKLVLEIKLDKEHILRFKTPYEGGMKTVNFHGYFITISEI